MGRTTRMSSCPSTLLREESTQNKIFQHRKRKPSAYGLCSMCRGTKLTCWGHNRPVLLSTGGLCSSELGHSGCAEFSHESQLESQAQHHRQSISRSQIPDLKISMPVASALAQAPQSMHTVSRSWSQVCYVQFTYAQLAIPAHSSAENAVSGYFCMSPILSPSHRNQRACRDI